MNKPLLALFFALAAVSLQAAAPTPGQVTLQRLKPSPGVGFEQHSVDPVNGKFFAWSGDTVVMQDAAGGAWGTITGTLSAQTDLQTALDARQPLDSDLTSIAALTTTTFGRSLLTVADVETARGVLELGSGNSVFFSDVYATSTASAGSLVLRDPDGSGKDTLLYGGLSPAERTWFMPTNGSTELLAKNGNGSALTALNASNISSGTLAAARLPATAVQTTDTGTVTNTMLAGSIANAKLANSSITINGAAISLGGSVTTNTVATGGTGVTSLTAYAPVFGGTTSTGALQSGTVGTSGQVLTSNGAGALPTFQTPATGLTIGTTAITSGTSGRFLYNNAGVVGERTAAQVLSDIGAQAAGSYAVLTANTFTGAQTISAAGAASAPGLLLSGAIYTSGSGTTNFPHLLILPSSGVTTNTGWNTAGTAIGAVIPDASTGNFFEFRRSNVPFGRLTYAGRMQGIEALTMGSSGLQCYTALSSASSENAAQRSILLADVSTGLRMASGYNISWSSSSAGSADAYSNNDIGFSRNSAGMVEVNNGTAGTWRDLKVRTLVIDKTITTTGTTGAQTINKSAGSVNLATGATSLVVTDSLVTASSVIICTVGTHDATCTSVQAVAGSGSFTIYPNAAPTGETVVYFTIHN